MSLKTYSKLCEDFFLNILTNLSIIISIGHTSQGIVDECVLRCLLNFSRDFKIKLHRSQ